MTEGASTRLFFALWPTPNIQAEFAAAAKQMQVSCGGHKTRRENIHLTLAFLGDTDDARLAAVMEVAQAIQLPGFDLSFTRLGWWQSNQVAWATVEQPPRALTELVKRLRLGLAPLAYKFDERRFFPHVSLLRKARCPGGEVDSAAIVWPVQNFALVRSTLRTDGAHYSILQRWVLAAKEDGA